MARPLKGNGATVTGRQPRGLDKKAADTDTAAGELHNAAARKELIREGVREILELKAQIKNLNEDKAAIGQRLKADLGLNATDLNTAIRLYQLEHDDRDKALDTLREVFEALGVGAQLDWITGLEQPAQPAPEPNDTHDAPKAEAEGYVAGKAGKNLDAHGYTGPTQGRLKAAWETGWQRAQAEIAQSMAPKTAPASASAEY